MFCALLGNSRARATTNVTENTTATTRRIMHHFFHLLAEGRRAFDRQARWKIPGPFKTSFWEPNDQGSLPSSRNDPSDGTFHVPRQRTDDRAAGRKASANQTQQWQNMPSRKFEKTAASLPTGKKTDLIWWLRCASYVECRSTQRNQTSLTVSGPFLTVTGKLYLRMNH